MEKLIASLQRTLTLAIVASSLTGCAILHHTQIGEIDNRTGTQQTPFEILVSENGVSTEEAGALAKAANSRSGDAAAGVADIISAFQVGPRTGNPVYNPHYAESLVHLIYEKCPSGRVTGLNSIREMRKYPVISGEIVKVTGYCLTQRQTADARSAQEH